MLVSAKRKRDRDQQGRYLPTGGILGSVAPLLFAELASVVEDPTGPTEKDIVEWLSRRLHRHVSVDMLKRWKRRHGFRRGRRVVFHVDDDDLDAFLTDVVVPHLGQNSGYRHVFQYVQTVLQLNISRDKISASLQRCFSEHVEARRQFLHRRLLRTVYVAPYFMYSWHGDVNEKILTCLGLRWNMAIDGKTHMMVYLELVLDKTAWTQFEEAFLPAVHEYGLPDQMVTDKGKESAVIGWFCEFAKLKWGREDGEMVERSAFRAVKSVYGQMRVETVWRIINNRLNYFVVGLVNSFIEDEIYDIDDGIQMGALQRVLIPALRLRAKEERSMYNAHYMERKVKKGLPGGKPVDLARRYPRPPERHRSVPANLSLKRVKRYYKMGRAVCGRQRGAAGKTVDPLDGCPHFQAFRENLISTQFSPTVIWKDVVCMGSSGETRLLFLLDLRISKVLAKACRHGWDVPTIKSKYRDNWIGELT